MTVETLTESLVAFIRNKVTEAGAKGAVVGVSGGLDSAVVLGLSQRAVPGEVLGVIMPCHSDPVDEQYALSAISRFGVRYEKLVLDPVWDAFVAAVGGRGSKLAFGNVKSRLRMLSLYHFAALNGYIVVGTGNKAELVMGYFTKYGDGGVDILPLANLTKTEVRQVAAHIGVPAEIIQRVPSGGLWPGQTDEGEMGVSYDEIDAYIRGEEVSASARELIERRRSQNEHKLRMPALPDRPR